MGLINFEAYDRLSKGGIDYKIQLLNERGFSFNLAGKTGPLMITDDNHILQTAPPESPRVCMKSPATIKYGVSYIKMSAQDVVDYIENYGKSDALNPLEELNIHLKSEDLVELVDLICLGLSRDKRIIEEGEDSFEDSARYLVTSLRRLVFEDYPSVFDPSVTDSDLEREIVRGLEYSRNL